MVMLDLKLLGLGEDGNRNVLHALGAPSPVAVVEIEPLALQDERAYAILKVLLASVLDQTNADGVRTCPTDNFFNAFAPILCN